MYFVVDLEATCWEKRNVRDKNEIIEIGLVVCDDDGTIKKTYSSFVRPIKNTRLSVFCRQLTRIEQKKIDEAFPLVEVMSFITGDIDRKFGIKCKDIPWCAFGDWDRKCLQKDCERHEIILPFGIFLDLKSLYVEYSGCRNSGLKQSVEKENLSFDGYSHRALDDALNAAKLAKFLVTTEAIELAIQEENNDSD